LNRGRTASGNASGGFFSKVVGRISGRAGTSEEGFQAVAESESLMAPEANQPPAKRWKLRPLAPGPKDPASYILEITVHELELRPDGIGEYEPGKRIQYNWVKGISARTPETLVFDWRLAEEGAETQDTFFTTEGLEIKKHFFDCVNWIIQERQRVGQQTLSG